MTGKIKFLLGLSVAALSIGSLAYAQAPDAPPPGGPGAEMHGPKLADETRAEAQARAEKMFDRLDVNHDGKLDKADRELMRQQMREKMFDRLDTNHDGSISKAEFMADRGPKDRSGPDGGPMGGPGDMPPPPPPGGPDGGPAGDDGTPPPPPGAEDGQPGLAQGDWHDRKGPPHGPGHGPMGPMGKNSERKADTNGDGAISKAEFVAAALKRFDMLDANHDGTVTKAERQAAFQKMRMERKDRRDSDRPEAPQQAPGQ